ncbi:unnamed protein product [Discula destructiva]
MRYDDWDVLLFPSGDLRDARVPLKEFKVNCHVVPDAEFAHNSGVFGLPAMTCFVPSLTPGALFHISIHCWSTPPISQHTLNSTRHPELVKFEARILIDGRMVASTSFEPYGRWPHLITTTCEMSKQGELQDLKFPAFRRELLYQNHWSPGDDIGRVKIIISEGFPRDSHSNPIERVKNIVAFSFQHAPLDILETNGIAWPNQQMWRRPQNNPTIPVPTFHPDDGPESHLHSPRRRPNMISGTGSSRVPMASMSSSLNAPGAAVLDYGYSSQGMLPYQKNTATSSSSGYVDPFGDAAYHEWMSSIGLAQHQQGQADPNTIWPGVITRNSSKQSGCDARIPDLPEYLASTMDQTIGSDQIGMSSFTVNDDTFAANPKVPSNTPIGATDGSAAAAAQYGADFPHPAISGELAHTLTQSLLNQPHPLCGTSNSAQPHQIPLPASEIRSRKENRFLNKASSADSPSSNPSPSAEAQIRKFSQISNAFGVIGQERDSSGTGPTYSRRTSAGEFGANINNQATPGQTYAGVAASGAVSSSGSEKGIKRSRNFTPTSAKAIDEEDEPRRVSPGMRLASALPDFGEALSLTGE